MYPTSNALGILITKCKKGSKLTSCYTKEMMFMRITN